MHGQCRRSCASISLFSFLLQAVFNLSYPEPRQGSRMPDGLHQQRGSQHRRSTDSTPSNWSTAYCTAHTVGIGRAHSHLKPMQLAVVAVKASRQEICRTQGNARQAAGGMYRMCCANQAAFQAGRPSTQARTLAATCCTEASAQQSPAPDSQQSAALPQTPTTAEFNTCSQHA
jgi:hypothetical protein